MNYGLYLSASGAMVNQYRQDVFANNLANVETVGFKPHVPSAKARAPESIEDNLGISAAKPMLDRLGGGALAGPQRVSFGSPKLNETGNPLDVALTGKQTFFAVETVNGEGNPEIALTRDGRFSPDDQGRLVTQSGQPVLNADDQPITVAPDAKVQIDNTGQVIQNGEPIDQLQVARIDNTDALNKQEGGLFAMEQDGMRQILESPSVKSGFVEASAVNPIDTLSQLIAATKSATGNANMVKYHDKMMQQAVTRLGRLG
jgi:flagellar basal body rod protein FlgG